MNIPFFNSCGWVDFWWVPIGAINILYTYHPIPPLGPTPQADISTPVKEEILLSPMRFPHHRKNRKRSPEGTTHKFDPTTLKADTVSVELEIGPSVILLYGTAIRNFMNFKENIFGEDQVFTDMQQTTSSPASDAANNSELKADDSSSNLPIEARDDFDHRYYRPLEVDVSIIMHDVQGHLLKNCTEKDPPCPVILVERVGFEMKKRYDQTELQLLLSPAVLLVSDNLNRSSKDKHLNQGKLTLSSLQIRGHAMFSDVGQTLDQDTIEYAWLVEIQLGKLSGKLTTPQLCSVVTCLETFVLLVEDSENDLNSPKDDALLSQPVIKKKSNGFTQNVHVQHMQQAIQQLLQSKNSSSNANVTNKLSSNNTSSNTKNSAQTKLTDKKKDDEKKGSIRSTGVSTDEHIQEKENYSEHKLKYKFCRVAIDAIDFWLVESGAALQLWLSPVRLSTCNLHGKQVSSGLSCIIYGLSIRQLVWHPHKYNHNNKGNVDNTNLWLEVGAINFGPLMIESAISNDTKDVNLYQQQQKFLKMHDDKLKKLWFLWPELNKTTGKCGCNGGCMFFGSNKNGTRFFKPSKKDLEEGMNVAAFRINESGRDPGYGQSILHEGMLVFRTPPYIFNEISLQDTLTRKLSNKTKKSVDSPRIVPPLERQKSIEKDTPDHKVNRRFSSTSIRGSFIKEVPYSRLIETSPANLPVKLDSDSKLHAEKSKLQVATEGSEFLPKNSVSDSKLAVDYFNAPVPEVVSSGPSSDISPLPSTNDAVNVGFNVSESHHSLNGRITSFDEKLQKEVQRTTSMSSENQSEAFFSADEDIHTNSRSSSLRNSILSSGEILIRQDSNSVPPQRKKFSSELSIVTDRNRPNGQISAPGSAPESSRLRLSSHRSDHEIHTPEHRSFTTNGGVTVQGLITPYRCPNIRSVSPRFAPIESPAAQDGVLNDPLVDSSDSYSSTSYASAVGSQEDLTLVDLHMQVNRLIVDSPMLMSSYVTHLSQVRCSNWCLDNTDQFSVPLFEKNQQDKLIYTGGRFVPAMETLSDGVTSLKMVPRSETGNTRTPTSPYIHVWDQEDVENDSGSFQEEELLGPQTGLGSRTTIIVKLRGDLDIMISPLLLETLQRFIDALTPTLANLHPLTVLNHLHHSCISQVEAVNVLKTPENVAKLITTTPPPNASTSLENTELNNDGVYEETMKSQLQAAVFFPKVNVTLLQVSIVEEIISFSALDNIKDLTCVSLFSVCFDNIVARMHCDKQTREILQKFLRPAVVRSGNKKGGANRAKLLLGLQTNTNSDVIQGEPVFIENCDKQQQQLVICLNVGKVHAQLRRLKNESSILEDAVITAIPTYKSKVLFIPTKVKPLHRGNEYYLQPSSNEHSSSQTDEFGDDKLGFIMFECGLEGITLKIVKKSQFEQIECNLNTSSKCDNNYDPQQVKSYENLENIEKSSNTTPKLGNEKGSKSDSHTPRLNERESSKVDDKGDKGDNNDTNNVEIKETSGTLVAKNASGNVSSCIIELKVVWFNFAAPPRAPITRKIDYTRLDWNLLSTASPAINAWMNPSNRLAIRVVHMVRTMYRRSTAIVACLMAEALEVQRVQTILKVSFYAKLFQFLYKLLF